MIGRYVLAALVAGLLAGAVLGALQFWRLAPLIVAAEVYEKGTDSSCKDTMSGMKMCADNGAPEWEPAPGLSRLGFTGAASMLAGGGFAAVLAGLSLLLDAPITRSNGWAWGLAGFFSVHLATGLGLPPELPGMPVADLAARQIWWVGTIIATAIAIYCFAQRKEAWTKPVGLAVLLLPHIIGAPVALEAATSLPPSLAASFAANALASAAVFWLVMGWLLGRLLPPIVERFEP